MISKLFRRRTGRERDSGDLPCPYLEGETWKQRFFEAKTLPAEKYEELGEQGWRRMGQRFYKNVCPSCTECVPIRILADSFTLTKSQRKCRNKNHDVTVSWEKPEFRQEDFEVFSRYDRMWHPDNPDYQTSEEYYRGLFLNSPVESIIVRYHLEDRLIAVTAIDVMPRYLSGVYTAYDPEFSKRGLGVFAAIKEIELCHEMGKPYYHFGFYVKNCGAMSYKAKYGPHEILTDTEWHEPEEPLFR